MLKICDYLNQGHAQVNPTNVNCAWPGSVNITMALGRPHNMNQYTKGCYHIDIEWACIVSNHRKLDCFSHWFRQENKKENTKPTDYWPLVKGIHRLSVDSPHTRPEICKAFRVVTSSWCTDTLDDNDNSITAMVILIISQKIAHIKAKSLWIPRHYMATLSGVRLCDRFEMSANQYGHILSQYNYKP